MSAASTLVSTLVRRRIEVALIALATGLAAFMVARHGHFITDDAFISLRYAKHLAAGHGYVFNPGDDPVEGFSNLSHVWLGALSIRLGRDPVAALRLANLGAFVLLPATTYLLSSRVTGSAVAGGAAACLVAIHPALAHWSGSGLETASFTWLVTGSLAVGLSRRGRWRTPLLVLMLLGAITTRPDGIVVPFVLGAVGLQRVLGDGEARLVADRLLPWALPVAVATVMLFTWRHATFGYWMPNSAYYKAEGDQTVTLVRDFVVQNLWLFALLPFARWSVMGRRGLALYGVLAAYFIGFYDVAPSISAMHRFFLPVFPALAVLATSALLRLESLGLGPTRRRAAAAVVVAGLMWADVNQKEAGDEAALARAEELNDRIRSRVQVAVVLAESLPPDASITVGDVGVISYLVPHHVYDAFGLNSSAFTHELELHRANYVATILRNKPSAIVSVSRDSDKLDLHYKTDEYLRSGKRFKYEYKRIAVVPSEQSYYYWIYQTPRKRARRWRGKFNRTGPLPQLIERGRKRVTAATAN